MPDRWMNAAVRTNIDWPTAPVKVEFEQHVFTLRPAYGGVLAPDVIYKFDDSKLSDNDAAQRLREFLSLLVWLKRKSLEEFTRGASSVYLQQIGPGPQIQPINELFKLEYLPDTSHSQAKFALALYREAVNINSSQYKFLAFWKVLSMVQEDGPRAQRVWLTDLLTKLTSTGSVDRLSQLIASGCSCADIAEKLYKERRCAVAHATEGRPRVNPDDPRQVQDLSADIGVIQAVAEYIIETEFLVKSEITLYSERGEEVPAPSFQSRLSPGMLYEMANLDPPQTQDS